MIVLEIIFQLICHNNTLSSNKDDYIQETTHLKINRMKNVLPKVYLISIITRDKPMANKLMHIPHDDTQNYTFFRLKLVAEETFGHSTNELNNQIP